MAATQVITLSIPDFQQYTGHPYSRDSEVLTSHVVAIKHRIFRCRCWPRGGLPGGFVSIFLEALPDSTLPHDWRAQLRVQFYIEGTDHKKTFTHTYVMSDTDWGFSKFISHERAARLLDDNALKIGLTITQLPDATEPREAALPIGYYNSNEGFEPAPPYQPHTAALAPLHGEHDEPALPMESYDSNGVFVPSSPRQPYTRALTPPPDGDYTSTEGYAPTPPSPPHVPVPVPMDAEPLPDVPNACVICMERPHNVVLTTCRHKAMCTDCAAQVNKCPMCRAPFKLTDTLEVFDA